MTTQGGWGLPEDVVFDGQRLRQVGPDGEHVTFRDPAAEQAAWATFARRLQAQRLRAEAAAGVPSPECLLMDPNPPAYRAAVDAFLDHARDSVLHGSLTQTYLGVNFFLGWAGLVEAHRPLEGARVYASGCGMAGTVLAYHAFGAAEVVGTEIDDETVQLGRLRTRGLPGVDVRLIDPARPLPFPDGHFDVVESLDVIEHVTDLEPYARELGRVLAPGGVAIVGAPNRMYPVEQHTEVRWVPWLPHGLGSTIASMGSRLPSATAEQRERRAGVADVRTANISWRTIEQVSRWMGATPQRLHRRDHPSWPLNPDPTWVEWLSRQPRGANLAPTRQVIGLLTK